MIADHYLQVRSDLDEALKRLLRLGADLQRPPSWVELVESLTIPVRETLGVVVIGDSQSGKSTLISALFDDDLPQLSSDRSVLLQYGAEERTTETSAPCVERHLPLDVLRHFKILDTAGTDKFGPQDRQLAYDFIQHADLVIVVLSAANPWTRATWDLIGGIDKTVLNNIVFVLQQADLREERALELLHRHFEDMARQQIGFAPPIFSVSARDALLARSIGSDDDRRRVQRQFAPLQEQINLVIGQSGGRTQKLRSACQLAQVLLHDVSSELRKAVDAVAHDEERLARANSLLQTRKDQTHRRVSDLLRQVEQTARRASAEGLPLVKDKLSFGRTLQTLHGQSPQPRDFQLEIDQASRESIERQIEQTAQMLETDLRAVWPQLHDLLDHPFASDIKAEVPPALPDFAGERRRLLHAVQMAMSARGSGSNVEDLARLFRGTGRGLQLAAAIALLSAAIALLALNFSPSLARWSAVVALLAAMAGVALGFYRRQRIIAAYQEQMQRRVAELVEIISWQFNDTIDSFHNQMAAGFEPLAAHCAREKKKSEPLLSRADELRTRFAEIGSRLR